MLLQLENISQANFYTAVELPEQLKVEKGEHLLVIGPSGCGKSTLLNLIAGLKPLKDGEIKFQDKAYSDLSPQQLDQLRSKHFGFIFQRLNLIGHLNVIQNISLAQDTKNTEHIHELIKSLGLEKLATQKARDLSFGEAQRVAIARALANKPAVIFADELTSSLDDVNTQKVMDIIFSEADKTNATIIAVTHDARIKDRFKNILEIAA